MRRHDHRRMGSQDARGIGYSLSVVSGRDGHDAARSAFGAERGDVVERSAGLERSRLLEIFELEADAMAGQAAQGHRRDKGSPVEVRGDDLTGSPYCI